MILREAAEGDADAIAAIYADAVRHGVGTFEERVPSPVDMEARRRAVTGHALPWLVADAEGHVAGYAYASPFRLRSAYRYVAEDTVYVDPKMKGRGVGRLLLSGVIERCEALGLRQLIALIGDSGNDASIRLHRSLGFELAGMLPSIGFKHDRWLDVVCMRRALGPGGASPPACSGLVLDEA